jgi:hypothetical protein
MSRVIQGNLLKFAAGFLILQTLIITLSPAVRARSLDVDFRWSQWLALLMWCAVAYRVNQSIVQRSSGSPMPTPISSRWLHCSAAGGC